jgi:hypothetical protein
MTMRYLLPALCLALLAGVSAADEDPATLERLLASPFGGVTETDEAPAFGDEDLLAAERSGEDRNVPDPLSHKGAKRDVRTLRIAIQWGYPRPHPEATDTVDWSGSLRVENAALRVLRTLRFEESDLVLRPRTDVHTVEFESTTGPHADGLLVEVILAPALNPEGSPVTLTFATPPHTQTIPLEPDTCHSSVVVVDDAGHVVAYHVIRPDADGCTEGFLSGGWTAQRTTTGREVGVIQGRFTDDEGRLRGHLLGVFGVRENGKQVWFAKVIDKDGGFVGLLAGRWGDGEFAGLFLDGDRRVRGTVRGHFRDGDADHDGSFIGRYKRCPKDPRKGEKVDDDEPDVTLDDDDC